MLPRKLHASKNCQSIQVENVNPMDISKNKSSTKIAKFLLVLIISVKPNPHNKIARYFTKTP